MPRVKMQHKDSDQPVLVLSGQVENMKRNGWREVDPAAVETEQTEKEDLDNGEN